MYLTVRSTKGRRRGVGREEGGREEVRNRERTRRRLGSGCRFGPSVGIRDKGSGRASERRASDPSDVGSNCDTADFSFPPFGLSIFRPRPLPNPTARRLQQAEPFGSDHNKARHGHPIAPGSRRVAPWADAGRRPASDKSRERRGAASGRSAAATSKQPGARPGARPGAGNGLNGFPRDLFVRRQRRIVSACAARCPALCISVA